MTNPIVRSQERYDLTQPTQPESPCSPVDEVVVSGYSYDIPLSVLRQQENKKCCDDKIKCLCKCIIL